jgi:hypothetical protein
MTTTNTFLNELQDLQFHLFWDNSTFTATKPTATAAPATEVKLETKTNAKKIKKNTSPHSQDWSQVVHTAISNLQRIPRLRTGDKFETTQLFSIDGCRYTVKSKAIQVFEIFPWFLLPHAAPVHRYRESLADKKGEHIDTVTAAINFFWTQRFEAEDMSSLSDYFLRLGGAPFRTLWVIVDLKAFIEKDRLARHTAGMQSEIQELSTRLFALEEKVKLLQAQAHARAASQDMSDATDSNSDSRRCKRKLDSLSEDDASESLKIQRVEICRLELVVDGMMMEPHGSQEKQKKLEPNQEQESHGETSDDASSSSSSSCDQDRDDDESLGELEDGEGFEFDGYGSGGDLPSHYLDEFNLEEYNLQQQHGYHYGSY